jgi:hypothetical protein
MAIRLEAGWFAGLILLLVVSPANFDDDVVCVQIVLKMRKVEIIMISRQKSKYMAPDMKKQFLPV